MKSIWTTCICILTLLSLASCRSPKLSAAREAMSCGEYHRASILYKEVYRKLPVKERTQRGIVAAEMAQAYQQLNQPAQASYALQNALRYQNTDTTLILSLARMKHQEGKYKEATQYYQRYLESKPNHQESLESIRLIQQLPEWKKHPTRYKVSQAPLFQLGRADFSPMITGESRDQLYFTTTNEKVNATKTNPVTGTKATDIFFSRQDEHQKWTRPIALDGEINTSAEEGTPAFSPDGKTLFFTYAPHSEHQHRTAQIYYSKHYGGKWGKPKRLEIVQDSMTLLAHPAVSADGGTLYFVSDMAGGHGGKDLYQATLQGTEVLGFENLGSRINTPRDEMFPTLHPSGDLLFSSNGHPGMGGLDLFRAHYDQWGVWSITNLQSPLNSSADDFGMTFTHYQSSTLEEAGFFASNRKDARGWDHILAFSKPTIRVTLTGVVEDLEYNRIPEAIVRVVGRDGSNQKVLSKQDGSFEIEIDRGTQYVMMAGAQGYLNDPEEFISDTDEANAVYEVFFKLAPLNHPVLIDHIYYDFDKASLRPESTQALNELVELLEANPYAVIEIAAHTDRKGSLDYNIDLSQRRAESVVRYLIAQGIHSDRLQAKGYGMTSPKVITPFLHKQHPDFLSVDSTLTETYIERLLLEQQEMADQINRRTEFQVIRMDFNLQ